MGNFSQVGINFSAFNNMSGLDFKFINMTSDEFINHIPENANLLTNDYYGIVVLSMLSVFLIWNFSDISQYGFYRYNVNRALGIALGITATIGIMMLSVGYMTNYIHLSILVALFMIILIYTVITNPT